MGTPFRRGNVDAFLAGHALADEGKITVFAAASLTNALQDIAAAYKREKRRGGLLFCLFLDAGAPDRSGRAGGSVHLGRPEVDGLRGGEKAIDAATRETLLG
jgi:hypothetical protein